eukprot:TRINITY_DN6316_c0_g2_i4.p1 TRINITY_DN6316_c0_g2~~TRINITY_DN6316_c0_g2_i4.p1  ORF type:complete len:302 (+),score=62.80 TRINITY_DN6316_c0_g2_i4:92-997(+)
MMKLRHEVLSEAEESQRHLNTIWNLIASSSSEDSIKHEITLFLSKHKKISNEKIVVPIKTSTSIVKLIREQTPSSQPNYEHKNLMKYSVERLKKAYEADRLEEIEYYATLLRVLARDDENNRTAKDLGATNLTKEILHKYENKYLGKYEGMMSEVCRVVSNLICDDESVGIILEAVEIIVRISQNPQSTAIMVEEACSALASISAEACAKNMKVLVEKYHVEEVAINSLEKYSNICEIMTDACMIIGNIYNIYEGECVKTKIVERGTEKIILECMNNFSDSFLLSECCRILGMIEASNSDD